uniref:Uncharacterized protein n=1 Tax=Nelumbo nucifera TaxID=4432 RepID=A0A822XSZ2_NELNU|nr:TPA_asm: hypothetical protein HUJ06_022031 [Nelumbo nucifera]
MVMKHEYSFNRVEHAYFYKFCNNLQPLFKLVSRNTIRADIMAVYVPKGERKTL